MVHTTVLPSALLTPSLPAPTCCHAFLLAVGDMLLVVRNCISNGVNDGLVWATEQRANGQTFPVRRAAYFTGGQAAVPQCFAEWCDG